MKSTTTTLAILWIMMCSFLPNATSVPLSSEVSVVFSDKNIEKEAKNCFRYFWELTTNSGPTAGLARDKSSDSTMLSMAATGFGLAAIPIGIENGWISKEEGEQRALTTLQTLSDMADMHKEVFKGFYYHFINATTGLPYSDTTEVSSIDTTLLIAGAIVAGEYFKGDVKTMATDLYYDIDWNFFLDKKQDMMYMSYTEDSGYSGHWDEYAEQLVMYFLGVGAPHESHRLPTSTFYGFERLRHEYGDVGMFIHSWFNSMFTYQFSHAFIDFRNLVDKDGVNWFDNSVTASKTHYQFALDNPHQSATYSSKSWGVTASETSTGYGGDNGVPPAFRDGSAPSFTTSIAPSAAISSMPFTPDKSYQALEHYIHLGTLDSEYGLVDAYDLDKDWVCQYSVGINKGITLLMLANYESGFIWHYFMQNEYIQNAINHLMQ